MDNNFQVIAVGDQFNLIKDRKYLNEDGVVLDVLNNGQFVLVIYLNTMDNEERELLKINTIKVAEIKKRNKWFYI